MESNLLVALGVGALIGAFVWAQAWTLIQSLMRMVTSLLLFGAVGFAIWWLATGTQRSGTSAGSPTTTTTSSPWYE